MAWIRLSDTYIDHPKFLALSDGAFRLWHEGMAYCRKHQTDGIIPFSVMRGFRYFSKAREKQLASGLWVLIPATGYKIHDYLDWNLSRDEEQSDRDAAAARMRRLRAGKKLPPFAACSGEQGGEQVGERSPLVPGRRGSDPLIREEDDELGARARRLLEELYPAWYTKYRRGARLRLIQNTLAVGDALTVCRLWDDDRIEKLARIVLTTDDDWISRTDRSFHVFAIKASWADDRLRQAEQRTA